MLKICLVAVLAAICGVAYPLSGTVALAPGSTVNNANTLTSNGLNPIGTLVADTGLQAFSFTGSGLTTTGELREVVYRQPAPDVTLDFYFQIEVTSGEVFAVTAGNFSSFLTSVGTDSPVSLLGLGPGLGMPSYETRSASGGTVSFIFTNPISAGEGATSVISTNGTDFTDSNIGIIGSGGGTKTLDGFQTAPPVAEVGTFWLIGSGLGSIALIFRRIQRRRS